MTNWIKEGNVPRVMIPTAMFPGLVLGLPPARVYAALAMRANNASGLVDSTLEQISADAKLSLSQVKAGLKLLLDNGWVTKVRQGNSRVSNKYRMHASPVEVATPDRPETKPVKGPETRPVNGAETRPVQPADDDVDQPEIRPEPAGNPAQTGRKSGHPLVSPPSCLPKDLTTTGGTTYPPADADAPRGEDISSTPVTFALSEEGKDAPTVIDAEIVEDHGERLFDVPADPAPKKATKGAKKPRQSKPVDPVKAERARQAQHLATTYHEAMAKMPAFMGVKGVVTKALDRFTYEQVRDGLKHLATVDRHRPLTGGTLLNAIETTSAGVHAAAPGRPPAGAPRLSTGDLRWVQGEFLKSSPNWDVLARFGVTQANAHSYGWQQPA